MAIADPGAPEAALEAPVEISVAQREFERGLELHRGNRIEEATRAYVRAIEIDPDTAYSGEPHEGNVYEYVFVFKGRLQITVEGETYVINENEFLRFPANGPHEYKCVGQKTVSALMQISYLA